MKKSLIKGFIILFVTLLVFSVIAFSAPFLRNNVFWVAYFFGIISILFQAYAFKIAFSGTTDVRSKFYGFPIARVGALYLFCQIIISFASMIFSNKVQGWVPIIISIVLLAFALVGCISTDITRVELERQDKNLYEKTASIRQLQSDTELLFIQCNNQNIKAVLEKLADNFKYSDPVSNESTVDIDNELRIMIDDLKQLIVDSDISAVSDFVPQIINKLSERNQMCKLNK